MCTRQGAWDIHTAFDSFNELIRLALDFGNLTMHTNSTVYEVAVDKSSGKAAGVSFLDSTTHKSYQAKSEDRDFSGF